MVSTIPSPWRARTKHKPRWPSCSLQKRGQTSHCTRPSPSVCQWRPGWPVVTSLPVGSSMVGLGVE